MSVALKHYGFLCDQFLKLLHNHDGSEWKGLSFREHFHKNTISILLKGTSDSKLMFTFKCILPVCEHNPYNDKNLNSNLSSRLDFLSIMIYTAHALPTTA